MQVFTVGLTSIISFIFLSYHMNSKFSPIMDCSHDHKNFESLRMILEWISVNSTLPCVDKDALTHLDGQFFRSCSCHNSFMGFSLITRQRLIVFPFSLLGQNSTYFFLHRWKQRHRTLDSFVESRLLKVCTLLTIFLGKKSRRRERSRKMPYWVQSKFGIGIELSIIRMRMAEVVSASWAQASTIYREGATPTLLCRAISPPP